MKKIRFCDNGYGLLISVRDVVSYLNENGVIGDRKEKTVQWRYYTDIFDRLKYQYRHGTSSMQINIFDFQDMFICWTELWLMKQYFTDKQRHETVLWQLFLILDSPHEIRDSEIFIKYEPNRKND